MDRATVHSIRRAVNSEDYGLALVLWNHYMSELRSSVEQGVAPPEDIAEALELVSWGRLVVSGARAQLHEQLRVLNTAAAYLGTPAVERNPRILYQA